MSSVIIDHAHYRAHAGLGFTASKLLEGVSNNGNLDIRFKTGSIDCHMVIELGASGKGKFLIYEGATISDGTEMAVYNSHRDSDRTATATVTHTPTVTSEGTTVLIEKLIPGSNGGNAVGAIGGTRAEFILKPDTERLFRVTNTAGTAQDLNIVMSWYENKV